MQEAPFPSVNGIKCLEKNQQIKVLLEDFLDLLLQRIVSWRSISLKIVLIFTKNFLNFWSHNIEKQGIIKVCNSYCKSYTSVVLCDSEVAIFEKLMMEFFVHFSIVFTLYTALHNQSISSNILVFYTSGDISSRLEAFLLLIALRTRH